MYNVQELHSFLCSFLLLQQFQHILELIYQLIFSSTYNLNPIQSKYSPISHDLSHSNSQLLEFQIYPLSHTPLSVNFLHSHRHLSLFQRCLLVQTLASSLHLHLHVSCHFMCLVLLVPATTFTCFNTKRIKYRLITININNFWSYFTCLIIH